MMCFRDMAFCSSTDRCAMAGTCDRAWTPEQQAAARKWWGRGGDTGPPVAFSDFSGRECFSPIPQEPS